MASSARSERSSRLSFIEEAVGALIRSSLFANRCWLSLFASIALHSWPKFGDELPN